MKKIVYIMIPIVVSVMTVFCLNKFLDNKVQELLETKDLSEISAEYGDIYKNKGVAYNEFMDESQSVMLQATSELKVSVDQVPTKFFPIKGMSRINSVGNQGAQSLNQVSILGSQIMDPNRDKVAMIVSVQWFYDKKGIPPENFQANFSPVQFYDLLDNKKISDNNKQRYSKRADELLTGCSQYMPEKVYAMIHANNNFASKVADVLFKPYYYFRKGMVRIKDKGLLYKKLKKLPPKQPKEERNIDWKEEEKKAVEQGKEKVTNNDFNVTDKFYNANKDSLPKQKDTLKKIDLTQSREFEDYQLYLDICSDLGIEPYIILMPTNGKWYDYLGLSKENRDAFYDKAEQMTEDKGFEVLNLKDKEYTPYFMCDAAHFGWKGWLEVDEQIYKHFKE